jgi:hypothetical protein
LTGIKEGDDVLIEAGENGTIHMIKRPENYAVALRGFHREIWQGIDPVEYVKKERESWEK